jgi:hypothetical protein
MAEFVRCTNCGASIEGGVGVCGACGATQPREPQNVTGESPSAAPPAGWYADPQEPASQRYWDGTSWTEKISSAPPAGWYDDPQAAGVQRYWDGGSWTDQVDAGDGSNEAPTMVARPTRRGRIVAVALIVLMVAGGAGVGAYFAGRSTGEDIEAARAAGAAAGRKAGTAKGTKQGYAEGLKVGREKGYQQTYADAYKAAYRRAFEDAGLAVPEQVSVPQKP